MEIFSLENSGLSVEMRWLWEISNSAWGISNSAWGISNSAWGISNGAWGISNICIRMKVRMKKEGEEKANGVGVGHMT